MSKEFHVFTHHDPDYEQAFVFEVDRHEEDDFVEFKDLLMITTTKYGELKTRIKFEDIIQSIVKTNGGNVEDSGVSVIVDMFKDLLPKDKQDEINQDLADREINNISAEQLINASEYAIMLEKVNNETDKGLS